MGKLEEAVSAINKQHGRGSIFLLGGKDKLEIEVIPTGIPELDDCLGIGGIPRGRVTEIYGPECLDSETFIQYSVNVGGRRANHKGGDIKRLYERFHNLPPSGDGRGKSRKSIIKNAEFYAPSVNEEGRIIQNKILDVVSAGTKECFKLETFYGLEIIASANHKFFTGSEFVPLSDLVAGDAIYTHVNTPFQLGVTKDSNENRNFLYVKNHPVAGKKTTGTVSKPYVYFRLRKNRAVVEADMNGLSFEEYICRLNAGDLDGLTFLDRDQHVHHKNEDESDDRLDNLEVLNSSAHGKKHATERHNNLRFIVTPDEIVHIESVGPRETYDLKMQEPYNNFVADGFVVHNSGGKTTLTLHLIAETQKLGGQAAFVDAEHALDPGYAAHLGVDINNLLVSQPDNGEQALEIVNSLVISRKVQIIVVDSVAALVPRAELEGDFGDPQMGLQARLMSQALRKLTAVVSKSDCVLVFINQIRDKIGVAWGNPETTTGGRALKFYSSIRLDVRKIKAIKKGDVVIGADTRIKVVKNKCARPFTECEIPMIYGEGFLRTEL